MSGIHINQKQYALTNKSKSLITTKYFDGELYALCQKNGDEELWLKVVPFKEPVCVRCGYSGVAVEKHHVHGRKYSNETIYLCANCHREIHGGEIL